MIVELPEWQPFARDADSWHPDVSEVGRVVAVVAPPMRQRDPWSQDLVLDLLEEWSAGGHKVMLVDGVFEHPTLHRAVALPNEEGASDAALFGASISRVARAVPGRSFFFMSAGSPTGEPRAIAGSSRWGRLQQGFRDAGVTLVVFMREGCAGEAEFVRDADDLVVLAESADAVPHSVVAIADKVRAVLGPRPIPEGSDVYEEAAASGTDDPPLPDGQDPVGGEPDSPDSDDIGPPDLDGSWDPGPDVPGFDQGSLEDEAVMELGTPGSETGTDVSETATEAEVSGADASRMEAEARPAEGRPSGATRGRGTEGSERTERSGGADPNAQRKLVWVAVGVIVLVLIVVLGALGPG